MLHFFLSLTFVHIIKGDLGGIDKKYDVAISTCCGRLDNIVVDTVGTAEQCILSLKQNNIGRATFIALEKIMKYAEYADPIQTYVYTGI